MPALVECVPNFSEGVNPYVIEEIVGVVRSVPGIRILDIDPGKTTNRTVLTFIGEPSSVLIAAFECIKEALTHIDMRTHKGSHPRQGAVDVCPFVPVSGITLNECVSLAQQLGEKVGKELGAPVYLYEEAATRPERRNLATIRTGEYEALPMKLKDPQWKPDYGPQNYTEEVARSGSIQIGAREFLIAWNVNLNTEDKALAQEIALNVREAGRAKRDEHGTILRHEDGTAIKVPGKLKAVKAVGWYVDEHKISQVSINQINYRITPLHQTLETIEEEAAKIGVRVLGAELVGLVPKDAILTTAIYYLSKQKRSYALPEEDLIRIGYRSLGLDSLTPFDPQKKIVEYAAHDKNEITRIDESLATFIGNITRATPTPGGGSAAALVGSVGASLGAMVCNLSIGNKKCPEAWQHIREAGAEIQKLSTALLHAIDHDEHAFQAVVLAGRQKAKTPEEHVEKAKAQSNASIQAAQSPLTIMKLCSQALGVLPQIAEYGNPLAASDAAVAAECLAIAAQGARYNVEINLPSVSDSHTKEKMTLTAQTLSRDITALKDMVLDKISKKTGLFSQETQSPTPSI